MRLFDWVHIIVMVGAVLAGYLIYLRIMDLQRDIQRNVIDIEYLRAKQKTNEKFIQNMDISDKLRLEYEALDRSRKKLMKKYRYGGE